MCNPKIFYSSTAVYECEHCLYETDDPVLLFSHFKIVHNMNETICPVCSYKTRGNIRLEAHMLSWHKDSVIKQKLSCKHCRYETDYNYYFHMHMQIHSAKLNYIHCNVCLFKTQYKEILKLHYEAKHRTNDKQKRPRKERWQSCPYCEFKSESHNLIRHLRNQHHEEHERVRPRRRGQWKRRRK